MRRNNLKNIKLVIEYDGTNYNGWQRQKTGRSIQQTLEASIKQITGKTVKTIAAGRTDSGVHARHQVVNFYINCLKDIKKFQKSLNSILPSDIKIKYIKEVPLSFHAQKSAKAKIYKYFLYNETKPPPSLRNFVWSIGWKLDYNIMKEEMKHLIGTHDFRYFQVKGRKVNSTIRTIYQAKLDKKANLFIFTIEANGFLYKMVRLIVGILIEIGRGKLPPGIIKDMLKDDKKDFRLFTAPAKGLWLWKIKY